MGALVSHTHLGCPSNTHTPSGALVTHTLEVPWSHTHTQGPWSHSHTRGAWSHLNTLWGLDHTHLGCPNHTHTYSGALVSHSHSGSPGLTHTQGAPVTHALRVPWSHSHTLGVPQSHSHTQGPWSHTHSSLCFLSLLKHNPSLFEAHRLEHYRRGGQRSCPEGRQAQLSGHHCPGHFLRLLWGCV